MKSLKRIISYVMMAIMLIGLYPAQYSEAAEPSYQLKTGSSFRKAIGTSAGKSVVSMAFHPDAAVPDVSDKIQVDNDGVIYAVYSNSGKNLDIYSSGPIYANSDFGWMFEDMKALTTLNLAGLNTSKAKNMCGVFYGCSALKSLDLSGFNTAASTDFSFMFYGCEALEKVKLSGFNTEKSTDFGYMFYGCKSLTSLDLSSFTVKTTQTHDKMLSFGGSGTEYACSSLTLGSGFKANGSTANLPNAKNTNGKWFKGNSQVELTKVTGAGTYSWTKGGETPQEEDPDSVLIKGTDFNRTLENQAGDLENIKALTFHPGVQAETSGFELSMDGKIVGTFNRTTGAVDIYCKGKISPNTDTSWMFEGMSSLKALDLTGLETVGIEKMQGMFSGCSGLTSLKLTGWNTSKVTNMSSMFLGCSGLTSLKLTGWNTSKVTNMSSMFFGCSSLTELDLSAFSLAAVTEDTCMNMLAFEGIGNSYSCSKLTLGSGFTIDGETAGLPDAVNSTGKWYRSGKWYATSAVKGAGTYIWGTDLQDYTITFYGNGSTSGSMDPITFTEGQSVTLPENTFKKTGYSFSSWNKKANGSGTAIKNSGTVSGLKSNLSLYAQWKANTYTISFNGNGKTSGTMSKLTAAYDKTITLTEHTYKKTGYTFTGWNTKKDGSGTSYQDEAEVRNLKTSGTVYLYAQWKANTYTVKFNGNGSDSGSMKSMSMTYDKSKTLTANVYKRKGYTFNGWNTKKDGSGTSYKNKASVKNLKTSGTITLYAQWKKK